MRWLLIIVAMLLVKGFALSQAQRLPYGKDSEQFGELRIPKGGKGPYPVAIVLHGGCWYARYNLRITSELCEALTNKLRIATWNLEYRRVGNGGGWPMTAEDVQAGAMYLKEIAGKYPIDRNRVIVVGHSAGGQLALWLGSRNGLRLRGAIVLAGISDMRQFEERCGNAVSKFAGRDLQSADPKQLLPIGIRQILIHGDKDLTVPLKISSDYAKAAREKGDSVELIVLPAADHFELIDPNSLHWSAVESAIVKALR